MKAYENELLSIFEELKDNAVITLRDVDKLMGKVSKCATSISNQRNELEQSRDNWKKECSKLKGNTTEETNE